MRAVVFVDAVGEADRGVLEPGCATKRGQVGHQREVMPAGVRAREIDVESLERLRHVPREHAGADVQALVDLAREHTRAHSLPEHPALDVGAGDDDRVDAEPVQVADLEPVVHRASHPPSTTSCVPVINDASSDSRNDTAAAMSSG